MCTTFMGQRSARGELVLICRRLHRATCEMVKCINEHGGFMHIYILGKRMVQLIQLRWTVGRNFL